MPHLVNIDLISHFSKIILKLVQQMFFCVLV